MSSLSRCLSRRAPCMQYRRATRMPPPMPAQHTSCIATWPCRRVPTQAPYGGVAAVWLQLPAGSVDVELLHDATRREARAR